MNIQKNGYPFSLNFFVHESYRNLKFGEYPFTQELVKGTSNLNYICFEFKMDDSKFGRLSIQHVFMKAIHFTIGNTFKLIQRLIKGIDGSLESY
jgi:hypothetical protein